METNTVYCSPCDEDIFNKLFGDAIIILDNKKAPSQAMYIDEDGIFFHVKLNKTTKQASMRPTGKLLSGGRVISSPIASIVMHLRQRDKNDRYDLQ